MDLTTKQTEKAVAEITASWHKSIVSLIETAKLLLDYSFREDWKDIQRELSDRGIMQSSVISMMLGIAQNRLINNPKYIHQLPPAYNTLYQLTQLDEREIEKKFKKGEITPSLRLEDVRTWRKSKSRPKNKPRFSPPPEKPTKDSLPLVSINSSDLEANLSSLLPELKKIHKKFPFLYLHIK